MINRNGSILDEITFDELITTIQSNEEEINEQTVTRVFNEILELQLQDAKFLLKKHMNYIIKEAE